MHVIYNIEGYDAYFRNIEINKAYGIAIDIKSDIKVQVQTESMVKAAILTTNLKIYNYPLEVYDWKITWLVAISTSIH